MGLLWIALILGIVEGLTEFLPVSSTGHLIVAGALVGLQGEKAKTFEVFIQLGAILAVVIHYRRRFLGLLDFKATEGKRFAGLHGCTMMAVTTLPVLVAGFLLHDFLKAHLYSPIMVAWALGAGGLAILLVERWHPRPDTVGLDSIGLGQALSIGLFQCVALWPGVSRAAATILGGMLGRLDRKTSAEYSFFAAVPALAAATAYDLYKSRSFLSGGDVPFFAVGFMVSFLFAWLAVAWLLRLLQHHSLRPFAWYRILIAPVIYYFARF